MSESELKSRLVEEVEKDFYARQAKSISNREFEEYAATLHKMLTDDDIMTHIKWSIKDTAKYFHVGEWTVRDWIKSGKLKAEHELTEMKGAKNFRWRWWVYVKDIMELEDQFKLVQNTYGQRYKVRAVWDAKVARVKQSTQA